MWTMAGGKIPEVIVPYIERGQDFLSPAPPFMAESGGQVRDLDTAAARPNLFFILSLY